MAAAHRRAYAPPKERVLVLLMFGNKLLLGRMKTVKLAVDGSAFPWGLPGGTRKRTEKLVRTANREAHEELNKYVGIRRFMYQDSWEDGDNHYHLFSVVLSQKEFREHIPPHREFVEFAWFKPFEIPWKQMLPEARARLEPIILNEMVRHQHHS